MFKNYFNNMIKGVKEMERNTNSVIGNKHEFKLIPSKIDGKLYQKIIHTCGNLSNKYWVECDKPTTDIKVITA